MYNKNKSIIPVYIIYNWYTAFNSYWIDLKCSNVKLLKEFKNSTVLTLQMKLLESTNKFKEVFFMHAESQKPSSAKNPQESERQINLTKAHFLEQSQEQVMAEVAQNEYREIEK